MVAFKGLKIVLGSVMVAGVLYAILTAPGFLGDGASTATAQHRMAVVLR